jgi:hypothetical protein
VIDDLDDRIITMGLTSRCRAELLQMIDDLTLSPLRGDLDRVRVRDCGGTVGASSFVSTSGGGLCPHPVAGCVHIRLRVVSTSGGGLCPHPVAVPVIEDLDDGIITMGMNIPVPVGPAPDDRRPHPFAAAGRSRPGEGKDCGGAVGTSSST